MNTNLNLKELARLLRLLERRNISELEFEDEKGRVRIVRGGFGGHDSRGHGYGHGGAPHVIEVAPVAPVAGGVPAAPGAAAAADDGSTVYVTSPFVGTFYRSPSPDSPPYIDAGQEVAEETVVCIIEAMKVMNEIKEEVSGVIVEVLAQNGKPVDFGKPLFSVRPK